MVSKIFDPLFAITIYLGTLIVANWEHAHFKLVVDLNSISSDLYADGHGEEKRWREKNGYEVKITNCTLYFMGQEALEIISLTKPGSDGNSTPPL